MSLTDIGIDAVLGAVGLPLGPDELIVGAMLSSGKPSCMSAPRMTGSRRGSPVYKATVGERRQQDLTM
jgi:hypothetical protein